MDNDEKKPELWVSFQKCKELAESLCCCILDFLFIEMKLYLVEFEIIEGLKEGLSDHKDCMITGGTDEYNWVVM